MKDYLKPFNDVFDIKKRLIEVDPRYRLFYNTKTNKYEVYVLMSEDKLELAFVCPYNYPDARLVKYARMTRVERSSEIFDEIEEHNKKIEEEENSKALSKPKSKLESVLNYLKKR